MKEKLYDPSNEAPTGALFNIHHNHHIFLAYLMIFSKWSILKALQNFEKSSKCQKKLSKNEENPCSGCLNRLIVWTLIQKSDLWIAGFRSCVNAFISFRKCPVEMCSGHKIRIFFFNFVFEPDLKICRNELLYAITTKYFREIFEELSKLLKIAIDDFRQWYFCTLLARTYFSITIFQSKIFKIRIYFGHIFPKLDLSLSSSFVHQDHIEKLSFCNYGSVTAVFWIKLLFLEILLPIFHISEFTCYCKKMGLFLYWYW